MFGPRKKRKVRAMSTFSVSTHDSTAILAEKLRGYGAKVLARMVGTSPRTAKNWLDASNAPTWKHTVAMLNDDELCAKLLEAAGRGDLARSAETIAALKAVIASEGK
jgi:hypothetical protein